MSEIEEEVGELRTRLDALAERVRLSEGARRFVEGNHEVRDGDFAKFSDGHVACVRINRHDAKWSYIDRDGHYVEPFCVPPEGGIERLYTIQEIGEILEQAFRARARAEKHLDDNSISAEAGGGLTGVESDIHGEPELATSRDLGEIIGDEEHRRRQSLIEAIGVAGFADAEWTTIVNHVRLMRENWDRFVADAASYKKRLDCELQVAQAESASWKQAHAELKADLQAKRNDLDFRRHQLCTTTGVREDSTWEHALADVKERWARVTAAHEAGVKMWREIEPRRDMQLPPTRTDLVAWMLTRIEELKREHASEIANIKHAFAHIEIERRDELRAIRDALQARADETTLDAAKRWVGTAMNEAALLNDIDEARGMLCGELVIDDPGNTVEVMRQAALAIARHRLSTETISKIRAELAAIEAKSSSHGSGETDHSQCGLGTVDDGPRDSDCPCRTSAALSACAAAGCGFCRAEVRMRTGPTRQRQGPRLSTETLNAQLRVLRNNWANDPEIVRRPASEYEEAIAEPEND